MPKRKEPHFFAQDLYTGTSRDDMYFVRDRAAYLRLFEPATDEKRVGEASVYYLYSEVAAREIKAFCPSARIIIMLRNPVDMVYSLHAQRLYSRAEDIDDFEEALHAEEDRRRGARIPDTAFVVRGLLYTEVARYTRQVQRYFDAFGRENVHVILHDDLRRDTAQVYREVCAFLDVSEGFTPAFEVVNPNTTLKNHCLQDLLMFRSSTVMELGRRLLPRGVKDLLLHARREIQEWNTESKQRPPLAADLRHRLELRFAPDVEALGALLGADLTTLWMPSVTSRAGQGG